MEELEEEMGEKGKSKHINTVVPWKGVVDDYWVGLGMDLADVAAARKKLLIGK